MKQEYIICAAIWYNDGIPRQNLPVNISSGIVVGAWRHGNCFAILHAMYPERDYILNNNTGDVTIQGFLTNNGRFVDRPEAATIAYNAKQIPKPVDWLFSENIY